MAEGGKKDAAYIVSHVISVVKHFCAEDVVQVFMDDLWMTRIRQNGPSS